MAHLLLTKRIEAPPQEVFDVFADFAHAAENVQGITKLEILTAGPVGVGTRFRETRVMFGKEATEEMEITAFDPGKSYEVTCQSCGAEFRSEFRFIDDNGGTLVEMEVNTRALSFFAKLMSPLSLLMMGAMKKCMEQDMEDLKKVAEGVRGEV